MQKQCLVVATLPPSEHFELKRLTEEGTWSMKASDLTPTQVSRGHLQSLKGAWPVPDDIMVC